MKKVIKLWNELLKSLIIYNEDNQEDELLEKEMIKDVENNSIKILKKRLDRNYMVSESTKFAIMKKLTDSFINKKTVDYFDEYLMNNYKKMGISSTTLMNIIMNDNKYDTNEIKNIMHEVEFFGDVNRQLKKDKGDELILTPEMVIKENDTDEYKKLIKDLCCVFNMGNFLPVKYEMDISELKIDKNSEHSGTIKNKNFIKYIENRSSLNNVAKQSFLNFNENEYKKEKWFLNLAKDLLSESNISPYETMKKYLDSKNENKRRLAVLLVSVGSYKVLKDITLNDIEKLSENVLAPYYLKFLNSFFKLSKPLYDNPQALEDMKNKAQDFINVENPIFIAIKSLENEKIKEVVTEIVVDLRKFNNKESETKNFALNVEKVLLNILTDFITLKEMTGKSEDSYLMEEVVRVKEHINGKLKEVFLNNVEGLQDNQKVMMSQMKKGM